MMLEVLRPLMTTRQRAQNVALAFGLGLGASGLHVAAQQLSQQAPAPLLSQQPPAPRCGARRQGPGRRTVDRLDSGTTREAAEGAGPGGNDGDGAGGAGTVRRGDPGAAGSDDWSRTTRIARC